MSRTEDHQFERYRRTGETGALAEAYDATALELWRIAWYLSFGDLHRAEDALQSTFLTAIEDCQLWDASRPLRPRLLGSLANHVRNDRRHAKRIAGSTDLLSVLPDDRRPSDAAERDEIQALVTRALQDLPMPYREVLILHLAHGISAREIGSAIDRKPGTVRTQIARGLELLRKALPVGIAIGATASLPNAALASQALQRVRAALAAHASGTAGISPTLRALHSTWKGYAMIASLRSSPRQ